MLHSMEPQRLSSSKKDSVDFHVSYVVLRRNSLKSQYFQHPLKIMLKYVIDSIEESTESNAVNETKSRQDIETKIDSPTYSSHPQRRQPLGNRIVKSSYAGRYSPSLRSEGVFLPNVSTKLTASTSNSSKFSRDLQRASSSMLSKMPSPEVKPPDSTPPSTQMLRLKDLRRLDFQLSNSDRAPSLLIRRHCMVLSFGLIRSVLLSDQVILLCPASVALEDEASPTYVTAFEDYLKGI